MDSCINILIQEDLDVNQRSELIKKLMHEYGILHAWFEDGNHHQLTLQYNPKSFSHITLLDTILEHGFHAEIKDT